LILGKKDALIIVDVPKDFCFEGSLPVPDVDKVVPVINDYLKFFNKSGAQICATRDWHPPNHISFKAFGGIWPSHCVQGSEGAKFHPDLRISETTKIISKGTNSSEEAYSGFDGTDLDCMLRKKGVERVSIGGLATEYCVKDTVLDSLKLGYVTVLLADATLGVNVKPDDSDKAIAEMIEKGAEKTTLYDILEPVEVVEEANLLEDIEEETSKQSERKRNARLRTRGPYRKALADDRTRFRR